MTFVKVALEYNRRSTLHICEASLCEVSKHFCFKFFFFFLSTSCLMKGFPDPVRFHFQGGFSFLTMLRRAKKQPYRPVAPPIDHLRSRVWHWSSF